MHIVLYAVNDWQVSDQLFAPQVNRITRIVAPLQQLQEQVVGRSPDVVFVSGFAQNEHLLSCLEQLCQALPTTAIVPHVPNPDPDFLLNLMRTGVREVLTSETPAAVSEGLARVQTRNTPGKTSVLHRARRIAFMSAKGGDGGTCVAANIATALVRDPTQRVLIIDLSLPFGDIEMYLTNKPITHDLADFSEEVARLDSALVDSMVHKLSDNLHLIVSPPSFDKVIHVSPDHVVRLIDAISYDYDFVLIDVGAGVDPVSLSVLEKLDLLVVVGTLTVPSLRRTSQILRLWESLGYPVSKVAIAINRFSHKASIQISDFEKASGKKISRTLPNDTSAVQESLLKGIPSISLDPKSEFSQALFEWADELAGKPAQSKSLWHRLKSK